MTMTTENHRESDRALERARQQRQRVDEQAAEYAQGAEAARIWLDDDRLAPRVRRAMRLRWGQ